MKYFLVLFLLQSSLVFAEKKVSDKNLSILGKIDEKNFNQTEPKNPIQVADKKESKFSISCKDSNGKEFSKGEIGYETCLSGIKSQQDLSKLNSNTNKKDGKDGNSANINFKIGD